MKTIKEKIFWISILLLSTVLWLITFLMVGGIIVAPVWAMTIMGIIASTVFVGSGSYFLIKRMADIEKSK